MSEKEKIVNIAVIAHVDAGKSTLVDAFLRQSDVFRDNEEVVDCVMDSNALERERGITIYSKNCSVIHNGVKINIVDTPGHADFSSEVERIMGTVDTVILLVDASEGPMPQTRFVLSKALEIGLKPILLINKIDKKDQRAEEVVDEVYDLFLDLNATDEQLDFPILYGVAREGKVSRSLDEPSDSIEPLFETILEHTEVYPDRDDEPAQMQVSALAYDDYIGRLGIGRIKRGVLRKGDSYIRTNNDGLQVRETISNLFVYKGLSRTPVNEARSGDIVVISGLPDVSIGDTVCAPECVEALPHIPIEEPTLSMNFHVNKSPFAGRSGKYVTSRNIKERLEKELEVNVGLEVEPTDSADCFKVSGRGELHISILIENMRREGYELAISKPEVILHRDENGQKVEPVEEVVCIAPAEYSGTIISKLNLRKGTMVNMDEENGYVRLTYTAPTRGLLGFRTEFINDTHGEGTLIRRVSGYTPYIGEIPQRMLGAMISTDTGTAMTYALWNLQERGSLFISPQTEVYEGMIIGESSRNIDMDVNPLKNKKLTAIRSSGRDEAMLLTPPRVFSLEEALEWINDDELVEVTPDAIRLRKKGLTAQDRRNLYREKMAAAARDE
ncbi:translational GTPase TypA [Allobaculum mucilyticum]|uniref:translational GTPase TypA n=1 Tax=Allobaculum mucilyticum TaxID=2834459 RepID=UPI001E3B431E|nr:translational GTPase TypA [Allobaculum mucilyticum]UNT95938.1 translational GTPase TypA [Allobaculum mucilyticum]